MRHEIATGKIPRRDRLVQTAWKTRLFRKIRFSRCRSQADDDRRYHLSALLDVEGAITSVAAMMLVDDGQAFSIDPVGKYISSFCRREGLRRKAHRTGKPALTLEPLSARSPSTGSGCAHLGLTYGFYGESAVRRTLLEGRPLRRDFIDNAEFVARA